MSTKESTIEKVKHKIDQLSEVELEKLHLYLSSLPKDSKQKKRISSQKLGGKLDNKNVRSIAYD
ncbi:MAG: hypothetical protein WC967_12890 [Balneolaceae bacterium]